MIIIPTFSIQPLPALWALFPGVQRNPRNKVEGGKKSYPLRMHFGDGVALRLEGWGSKS